VPLLLVPLLLVPLLLVPLLACRHAAPLPAAPAPSPTALTPEIDGLRGELVTEGSAAGRAVGGDEADLVLLYSGEEGGDLGPCGCKVRPRGGLGRIAAYRDAVRAASPGTPVLLLDAGGWLDGSTNLDGTPRLDVPTRNSWMLQGVALLQPDALNLAPPDMLALAGDDGPDLDAAGLPLVSANLQAAGGAALPWRVIQAGELRIGVTGIAAPGPTWMAPEGWTLADPLPAARALLAAHRDQVDLVVLLSHAATPAARSLAQEGLVDVVIDAENHHDFSAPFRVGDAVWVRSHDQTMRLGELRLYLQPKADDGSPSGRIARALDRKIDLDEAIAEEPALGRLRRSAELATERVERARYGRTLP